MDISDISLDQIHSFVNKGIITDAPEEVIHYINMMDKVRGMYLRQGDFGTKNSIVNHLIKIDGLSYYLANKLYNQTLEYFYCSSTISKKAWDNIYADKLDDLAAMAQQLVKEPRDLKIVADIIVKAREARHLDEPDIPELPKALFEKPFKLYAMDPEFLGMAPINRNALAQRIDSLDDFTEPEKDRLKSDAAIKQIILFPNEQEDVRKQ
jgi:hypothetical protein